MPTQCNAEQVEFSIVEALTTSWRDRRDAQIHAIGEALRIRVPTQNIR